MECFWADSHGSCVDFPKQIPLMLLFTRELVRADTIL